MQSNDVTHSLQGRVYVHSLKAHALSKMLRCSVIHSWDSVAFAYFLHAKESLVWPC